MHLSLYLCSLLSVIARAMPSLADNKPKDNTDLVAMPSIPASTIQGLDLQAESVSMMVDSGNWTIRHLSRKCNDCDTECKWEFYIDTGCNATSTACKFTVKGENAHTKDSRFNKCGCYDVSTGYSPATGCPPGQPFTVLSVVDYQNGLIVWPSYTEKQLSFGKPVCPDQSYNVARIPGSCPPPPCPP